MAVLQSQSALWIFRTPVVFQRWEHGDNTALAETGCMEL